MDRQFVVFTLNSVHYCIDIMSVYEVVRENKITQMPNFPPYVEGVINLRGQATPILAIDKKNSVLTLGSAQVSLNTGEMYKLIIINVEGIRFALRVDSINQILTVDSTHIQDAETLGMIYQDSMIAGIINYQGIVYRIIDTTSILDMGEAQRLVDNFM